MNLPLHPLLVVAIVVLAPRFAAAYSPSPSVASGELVLPADGQAAPRNTRLWAILPLDANPQLALRDGSLQPVALLPPRVVTIQGAQLVVAQPQSLLMAGALYELSWVGADGTHTVLSHFTTTTEVDLLPPPQPRVVDRQVRAAVRELHRDDLTVISESRVELRLDAVADIALVVADSASAGTEVPSDAVAYAGATRFVTVRYLSPGEHTLTPLVFDLAGNASAAEPLMATVPETQVTAGCNAGGGAPLLLLLALFKRSSRARK